MSLDNLFITKGVESLGKEFENLYSNLLKPIAEGKNIGKSLEQYADGALNSVPFISEVKNAYVDIVDRKKNVLQTLKKMGDDINNNEFMGLLNKKLAENTPEGEKVKTIGDLAKEKLGEGIARSFLGGDITTPTTLFGQDGAGQPPLSTEAEREADLRQRVQAFREGRGPMPSFRDVVRAVPDPSGAPLGRNEVPQITI